MDAGVHIHLGSEVTDRSPRTALSSGYSYDRAELRLLL